MSAISTRLLSSSERHLPFDLDFIVFTDRWLGVAPVACFHLVPQGAEGVRAAVE